MIEGGASYVAGVADAMPSVKPRLSNFSKALDAMANIAFKA